MTQQAGEKAEHQPPSGLDGLIERKIAEAYAAGLFDNLQGTGKPLDLRQNPFQDPAWRLAFHVLQNAGMAPAWVEERRSLQEALSRVRQAEQDQPSNPPASVEGRSLSVDEIRALNKRIESLNLTVPHPAFRLEPIRD